MSEETNFAETRPRTTTNLPKKPKLKEFSSKKSKDLLQDELVKNEVTREKLLERRTNILNELFRTEATYVEYLQVAITIFYRPIANASFGSRAHLPEGKLDQIFQNIEQLHDINAVLLKKMAIRKSQLKSISGTEVWLDLLTETFANPTLKEAYQKYMHGYNHAVSTLEKFSKRGGKNTGFGSWVQNQLKKNNDLCRGLGSLPAFLICPVQRLPRYLLILRDIKKCTPEDHPDYPNLIEATKLAEEIVGAIDKGKTRYDEVYYLQSLYERFNSNDRQNVDELINPHSILVTEGPILLLDTVSNSFKLRYLIVLSHTIICTKKRKDSFTFSWKVDLYHSLIQYAANGDGADSTPFIRITEQKKLVGDNLTSETIYTLYTFSEDGCEYNYEFWENNFLETQSKLLDVSQLALSANTITTLLSPQLLLKRDWDLLAVGASVEQYKKGDKIIDSAASITHLHFINNGRCSIESGDNVIALLSENDFYGEISYLEISNPNSKISVIAESDTVSITKISFDRLTSILSGNADLAKRFFHVVSLVASRYYLNKADQALSDTSGESSNHLGQSLPTSHVATVEEDKNELPEVSTSQIIEKKNKKIHPALIKLKLDEIAPDEEILQEYSCKLKKTKFSGQFYVMKEYIGFYSNVLGKKTRLVVPGRSVTEVVARDDYCIYINNLKHNVGPFELQFKSEQKKQEAYTILASFLSDKKRSLAAKTGMSYTAGRGTSLFSFTDRVWEELISFGEKLTTMKNDIVITQGTMNDKIYQVISGKFYAKAEDLSTNATSIIDVLNPGELFGEISFLLGLASNVTIESIDNGEIIAIPRQHVERLMLEREDFSVSFYKFVAKAIFTRIQKIEIVDQIDILSSYRLITAPLIESKQLSLSSSPLPRSPITRRVKRRDAKPTSLKSKLSDSTQENNFLAPNSEPRIPLKNIEKPISKSTGWVTATKNRPDNGSRRQCIMSKRQ